MSRKTKLILYFAANLALPIIAICVIIFGRIFSQSPYNEYINCPSLLVFGIYCPFCGVTRAMAALLQGKILTAFICNPAFVLSLPYILYYDVITLIHIIKKKEKLPNISLPIAITLGVILIAYFIFRTLLLLFFDIDLLMIA